LKLCKWHQSLNRDITIVGKHVGSVRDRKEETLASFVIKILLFDCIVCMEFSTVHVINACAIDVSRHTNICSPNNTFSSKIWTIVGLYVIAWFLIGEVIAARYIYTHTYIQIMLIISLRNILVYFKSWLYLLICIFSIRTSIL